MEVIDCFRILKAIIILFLFFLMNNVPNKNSKVLEETVAGFNSYAAEKKLRGLRNFKMTLPLFQVLEMFTLIPLSLYRM